MMKPLLLILVSIYEYNIKGIQNWFLQNWLSYTISQSSIGDDICVAMTPNSMTSLCGIPKLDDPQYTVLTSCMMFRTSVLEHEITTHSAIQNCTQIRWPNLISSSKTTQHHWDDLPPVILNRLAKSLPPWQQGNHPMRNGNVVTPPLRKAG